MKIFRLFWNGLGVVRDESIVTWLLFVEDERTGNGVISLSNTGSNTASLVSVEGRLGTSTLLSGTANPSRTGVFCPIISKIK